MDLAYTVAFPSVGVPRTPKHPAERYRAFTITPCEGNILSRRWSRQFALVSTSRSHWPFLATASVFRMGGPSPPQFLTSLRLLLRPPPMRRNEGLAAVVASDHFCRKGFLYIARFFLVSTALTSIAPHSGRSGSLFSQNRKAGSVAALPADLLKDALSCCSVRVLSFGSA